MPTPDNTDDDLRATLTAAADAVAQTENDPEPATEPVEPAEPTEPSAAAPATPQEGTGEPAPAPETAPAPAEGTSAAAPEGTSPPPPPSPAGPNDKAPGTWTPAMREKWSTIDPEVRAEIWKREKDASRALTISSEARKFNQEFQQVVQPFMGFIAAEGSTPLQAVQNVMQTAAILRVGTPQQKVQVVADVIKQFGVDLGALDSVLAGQMPQFNPAMMIQQQVQQALQPFQQQLQSYQQKQHSAEAALEAEAMGALEQFANDPKHEFYGDVKDIMADLMEVAMKRGMQMDLTEAYERATMMYEPVRRVIEGRRQTEAASSAARRAAAARNASSSISSSAEAAVTSQVPADDSIRSAIEFSIAAQQGR